MSSEFTSLPTDSLYKMLTIGGIVLVVGGLALSWKAIDETQSSQIALVEADTMLRNAVVPVQLEYKAICTRHKEIEDEIGIVLSGVNRDAQKEFKGGQPNDFPSLADSLHSFLKNPASASFELGVASPPAIPDNSTVQTWIRIAQEVREHKVQADGFLTAPNLTIIPEELASKARQEFAEIQSLVTSLEQKAIALSPAAEGLKSAQLRHQLAERRQSIILLAGSCLFFLGTFVFARASKNWYEQVQRFEDAKLHSETKGLEIGSKIAISQEFKWLFPPLLIALIAWLTLLVFSN